MRSTQLRWIFLLGLGSMPVVSGCAAKNVSGSTEVNYKRSSLSDLVSESDKDLATATIYDFFALKEGSVNLDWIMNLEYALKKETFEFLYLPKMTHLRVDIAAKIATFEGRYLSLNGVQSFDAGALEELGNFEGSDLSLGALNTIDVPTADALANCSAYVLSLNGLGELDASSAMSLATFQGGGLALNGLRNLSSDAIGKLSAFRGDSLSLNGLESLDAVAATALAAFKGGEISLNGVASIDTETATALAAFQGDSLSLNGLRDIDEEAARALANYGGYIATSNNAMERIAKEFLQKNQEKQAGFTAPENVSTPPSDAKKSDSG
ncbi:MAG: hypothetical protein VX278_13975, partial [Myxococcota bacterium]|nr:hypothetical protein [Myxococcota bacterium]